MRVSIPPLFCLFVGALLGAALIACGGSGGGGGGNTGARDTFVPTSRTLALLRGEVFRRLIVEVDAVPGFEIDPDNETEIGTRLASLVDKPGGISVVRDEALAPGGTGKQWTFAELRALAIATRDFDTSGDQANLHVLCVDGRYASGGSGTVLGIAWDQENIVLFQESIRTSCTAQGIGVLLEEQLCDAAELAILLHELGHCLGLVDNGTPMVQEHEDTGHPAHDRSQDCVMYWAYEGDAVVQRIASDLLGGGNGALDFDAECLEDLAAIRDAP